MVAGESGAGPITQFDCSEFATKFACEVKNWDASKWFDKRELKHVDRFLPTFDEDLGPIEWGDQPRPRT